MEQQGVDFFSLPRRQLQTLCKQYKIPANTTNVAMATALDNLLNKENGCEINIAELLTPHKAPDSVAVTPGRLTRSQAKKQVQESAKRTDTLAGRELFVEGRSARKPPTTRNMEDKQVCFDGELSSVTNTSSRVRKPRTCKTTPRALHYDPDVVVHGDDSAALSKEVSSGTCSSGLSSVNVDDTGHDTSVESIRKDGNAAGEEAVPEPEGIKDQTSVSVPEAEAVEESGVGDEKRITGTVVEADLEVDDTRGQSSIISAEAEVIEDEDDGDGKKQMDDGSSACVEAQAEDLKDQGPTYVTEADVVEDGEQTVDETEPGAGVDPKPEDIKIPSSPTLTEFEKSDAEAATKKLTEVVLEREDITEEENSISDAEAATKLTEVLLEREDIKEEENSISVTEAILPVDPEAVESDKVACLDEEEPEAGDDASSSMLGSETDNPASDAGPDQGHSELPSPLTTAGDSGSEGDDILVKDNAEVITTAVVNSVQVDDGQAEKLAELDEEVLEEVSLDPALAIEVEQLSQALSEVSLCDGLASLASGDAGCGPEEEGVEELELVTAEQSSDCTEDESYAAEEEYNSSMNDYDATEGESDSAGNDADEEFSEESTVQLVCPEGQAPGDDVKDDMFTGGGSVSENGSIVVSDMVSEVSEVSINNEAVAADELESCEDDQSSDKNVLCVLTTSDAPVIEVMDAELQSVVAVDNVEPLKDVVQKGAEVFTEGVIPGCDAAFGTPVEDEGDQFDAVDSENGKDQSSSMEPENASAKPKKRNNKRRTGKENTPLMVQRLSLMQLTKLRKGKLNNQRKKETRAAKELGPYSENGESSDKSVLCILKDEALEDSKLQENAEKAKKPSDGVKQRGETVSVDEESSDKSIADNVRAVEDNTVLSAASTVDNVDAFEDSEVQENAEEVTKPSDGVKQHGETAAVVEADEESSSDKSILCVTVLSADNVDALEDSKVQGDAKEVTKPCDGVTHEASVVEPAEGGEVNHQDDESSRASTEAENASAQPQKKQNKKLPTTGKENLPLMFQKLSLRQLRKIHKEKIDSQRKKEVGTAEPMQKSAAVQEMQKKNQKGSVSLLLRKTTPLSPNSGKNNRAH